MTIYRRFYIAALVALSIGLVAGAPDPTLAKGKYLSGAEIKQLFTGKSVTYWGKTSGRQSWTGTTVTYHDKKWGTSTGKWWIKGNKFCRKHPKQKTRCHRILDNGDGTYTGAPGYKMKFQ